jgi:hypothetical protein
VVGCLRKPRTRVTPGPPKQQGLWLSEDQELLWSLVSLDSQPPDRKVFAKRSQNCSMCWNEISSQGDGSNIIPATDVGVPHKRQVPKGGRVGKKYSSTKTNIN